MAGVVGFSGRLLSPETLADEVVVRPPVLLIHGDQDEVVPAQSLPEAAEASRPRVGRRSTPMS
jgi:phospholipase/carboxylesterase